MKLNRNTCFVLTMAVLVAVAAGILISQRRAAAELVRERQLTLEQHRRGANLRAEIARLAAVQPEAAELERLREDRDAARRLRAEIEALKEAAKTTAARPVATPASQEPARPKGTFAEGRLAKAEEWRNVGRATPIAAFESALWAAAAGDIDALASSLVFDPTWRAQVDQLWAKLSEPTRTQYATPERLFAALTAKDIPLGAAQVMREQILKPGEMGINAPGETTFVMAALTNPKANSTKRVGLFLHPSPDGWLLMVPGAAVVKYRDLLTGKERTAFEVSAKR